MPLSHSLTSERKISRISPEDFREKLCSNKQKI